MSKKKTRLVYLDNNGTTDIHTKVIDVMNKWFIAGKNPSSTSIISQKSRELVDNVREQMLNHCSAKSTYECFFTSGASESNSTIIRSACSAYIAAMHVKPTIIISGIEHESIMNCCKAMEKEGIANICTVMPNYEGLISTASVEEALNSVSNVAIVCIMYANNELGAINNIRDIGALVHSRNIPLHVDAVQLFGKYRIHLDEKNIASLSMSFHKMYGPKSIGLLYVSKKLMNGYKLNGIINGRQQAGFRGGTQDVASIAGAGVALSLTFEDRAQKNEKLLQIRRYVMEKLGSIYQVGEFAKYIKYALHNDVDKYNMDYDYDEEEVDGEVIIKPFNDVEILFLGPEKEDKVLPNTLLVSLVKNQSDSKGKFCNVKLKEDLDKMGVVVSIGSVCLSDSNEASHVVYAIQAPPVVRRGVIRVSWCDKTSKQEIDYFIKCYEECVAHQVDTNKKSKPHTSRRTTSAHATTSSSGRAAASDRTTKSSTSTQKPHKKPSSGKRSARLDLINQKIDKKKL
jgi:cysteine desulfurase